jgi:hypothetical protein
VAFPEEACGAGHIRWPKGMNLPLGLVPPFGVIVLVKQSLRMEQAAWSEGPTVLHCFVVQSGGEAAPVEGGVRAVVRSGPFVLHFYAALAQKERALAYRWSSLINRPFIPRSSLRQRRPPPVQLQKQTRRHRDRERRGKPAGLSLSREQRRGDFEAERKRLDEMGA